MKIRSEIKTFNRACQKRNTHIEHVQEITLNDEYYDEQRKDLFVYVQLRDTLCEFVMYI